MIRRRNLMTVFIPECQRVRIEARVGELSNWKEERKKERGNDRVDISSNIVVPRPFHT